MKPFPVLELRLLGQKPLNVLTLAALGFLAVVAPGCNTVFGTKLGSAASLQGAGVVRILAATDAPSGKSTVYLAWPEINRAKLYKVYKSSGGTDAEVTTFARTDFNERVEPGAEVTYFVKALDENGSLVSTSDKVTAAAPKATLQGKPTGLKADGKDASTLASVSTLSPTLSWEPLAGATHYFVQLSERMSDGEPAPVNHLGIFTRETSVKVGKKPDEVLLPIYKIDNLGIRDPFYEVKNLSLENGRIYVMQVTAFKAETSDLASARSVEIADGDSGQVEIKL